MKFLLIFPPSSGYKLIAKRCLEDDSYIPPLGLLYIARILLDNGHTVEVIDYTAEHFNELKLQKKLSNADVVGMTILSSRYELPQELAAFIRKCDSDIPLFIGGPHCSVIREKALLDFPADVSVMGDVESRILLIVEALQGKRKFSSIPGIFYREGEKIRQTKPLKSNINLDAVPFPARHLVDKYEYGYFMGVKLAFGKPTSIVTTRGCPFGCRFCGIRNIQPWYQERSVENVQEEVRQLAEEGYKTLQIMDDNFLVNKKRAEKIMDFIIRNKFDLDIWIGGARVDSADRRLYEKIRDAGGTLMNFGLESGNQDVLDFYNKKITLEQIKKAVNLSVEMGFFTTGSFILGAPIETEKHLRNTMEFAKKLPLDFARFFPLGYLCGAPLWIEKVKEGVIQPDEYVVTADSRRGLGRFTQEELVNFCQKAHNNIFYDPRFILRQIYRALYRRNFRYLKLGMKVFTGIIE